MNAMRRARQKTRKLVVAGMLSGITMVLGLTPLGIIPIGPLNATILHVPVIIGAVLEGPVVGFVVGLIFGLFSLYRAAVGGSVLAPLFLNPVVTILPRVLIGPVAYYVYRGLTHLTKKRALPAFPKRIGLATSERAAAFGDVRRTLARRMPWVQIGFAEAAVQGPGAAASLVRALDLLDGAGCDVILLVRGGGAYEDLQAYNDEGLARAIRALKTPVVSGIGHETDFTIAGLDADGGRRSRGPGRIVLVRPPQKGERNDGSRSLARTAHC